MGNLVQESEKGMKSEENFEKGVIITAIKTGVENGEVGFSKGG